jgi:hypothetical protein
MRPFCGISAGLVLASFSAQTKFISGTVIDAYTKQGIPFARISLAGQLVEATTDKYGHYKLLVPSAPGEEETVRISRLSYEARTLVLGQLFREPTISLEPASTMLAPVMITGASSWRRTHILGSSSAADASAHTLRPQDLGAAAGTVIHLSRRPTRVLSANFAIARTSTGTATFRVTLYRVTKQGQPTQEKLLNREVLITAPVVKGILTADLRGDNLVVEEDFLLAVELTKWQGYSDSQAEVTFSGTLGYTNKHLYLRSASRSAWRRASIGALAAGMQPRISFFVQVQD